MSPIPQSFYHTMLGLPADVRTPDHYELLGINRFEADVERIRTAAIDRNRQLLSWQNSEFHTDVDRLMGEVVAAREVLFDPQRKAAYDRQLGSGATAAPVVTPGIQSPRLVTKPISAPRTPTLEQTEPATSPPPLRLPAPTRRAERKQPARPTVRERPVRTTVDLRWRLAGGVAFLCTLVIARWMFSQAGVRPLIAPFTAEEAQAAQTAWAHSLGMIDSSTRNSIGMELVLIPPGKFTMGSPAGRRTTSHPTPQVEVTLTQPLFVSQTEVTQGQWLEVMNSTPWRGQTNIAIEGTRQAASYISWFDAQEFCRRLSEKEGVTYRLLTEAEWEYACRAGTTTKYHFGDSDSSLGLYAWSVENAFYAGGYYNHEVGLKLANSFGLKDMTGHVWEWCADSGGPLRGGTDPLSTIGGNARIVRGGAASYNAECCQSAFRHGFMSPERFLYVGFRVAAVPSSGTSVPAGAAR